MMTRVFERL
jgi:protein-tyrosine phosphatase